MEQELKNDLIASFNEAEELHTSFTSISNEELIECKDSLIERIEKLKYCLGKYVSDEDIIENL